MDVDTTNLMRGGQVLTRHELLEHLAGRMTLEEAVEQIKIGTRQLARRQMKWFKRFPGVLWLPGEASVEDNVEATLKRLCI